MKLSVFERLNCLSILPVEGSFFTLKIMRKLREDLSFSEEENKLLDFKTTWKCLQCGKKLELKDIDSEPICPRCLKKCPKCGAEIGPIYMVNMGWTTWNKKKAKDKDIPMGDKAKEIIAGELKKLNDAKPPKLRECHFTLYEKFVGEE